MSTALEVDFRPDDPAFVADPYPAYARLRDECPIFRSARIGMTMFARHGDVRSLVLDARLGRTLDHVSTPAELERRRRDAGWGRLPNYDRYVRVNLLEAEGADHARLRRLVAAAFGPRRIGDLRGRLQARVDELLDRHQVERRMDFIADLAAPLPVHMIADLLGWPDAERHRLRSWSARILRLYEKDHSIDDEVQAERATGEFAAALDDLAAQRRAEPRDDLLSALVSVCDEGERLSSDELTATCMLLLNAGHEATANAAGNGLWALLKHPGELARLRKEPSLVPAAVEEMLRYDAPLQLFHRYVLEDMEIQGIGLARGDKVGLLYGSANRDPRAFDRADEFDVGRAPNRHFAFGAGTHFCLGAPLARLELEVLFETLVQRLPELHLAGDPPRYRPGLVFRGLAELQLSW
jgi:cytochrome P450